MSGEWSDWIQHDGSGCPLPLGTMCEREFDEDTINMLRPWDGPSHYHQFPVHPQEQGTWSGDPECAQVIRYRYLRPAALVELIRMAEAPQPVTAPAAAPETEAA
ncbi:hypothetical protein [Roseicyclus amphidinii]|uniref:hypothetical protein n=1 Tax=Roseicyclus amphidinii TaxID=3034232 RepID=UPI0024E194AE|nr:hypothetical protein [Roseicyclus sp. Amp-Y-6]